MILCVCDGSDLASSRRGLESATKLFSAIELHRVRVAHAIAAENIERGPDGKVYLPAAKLRDQLQIRQRAGATGIGSRQRRPLPELRHQFAVNTPAQTFHIHRVDEKLGTICLLYTSPSPRD